MDGMVKKIFKGCYQNRRVFVTGHTGFKGSWLVLWLKNMGAIVKGYSLEPNTNPNHWSLLDLDIESIYGDIRNRDRLAKEIVNFKPEIVFHLAAQPIVRLSYLQAYETYETNVMGTMSLFEACRKLSTVKAIVNITSDKCYENQEWEYGYREQDLMGGYDPYSSSKGCSELLTSSYRRSFWNLEQFGDKHNTLLANCRAGNVIGGGDWAQDRLIPDIMKSVSQEKVVEIRNPNATRPWQHVLESLSGYLLLGQKLLEGQKEFASAWNFGPQDGSVLSVGEVADELKKFWKDIDISYGETNNLHEANLLKLDCSKAIRHLNWKPVWSSEIFEKTSEWYREFYINHNCKSSEQLECYIKDAYKKKITWTE